MTQTDTPTTALPVCASAHRYTGKERDAESGLDYFGARYYASNMGRWMSPDPYDGSMDLGNPQSLNRYNYAANNPLRYIDPSGLDGDQPSPPDPGPGICWSCIYNWIFPSAPSFHGSITRRADGSAANRQIWDEYHIHYGGDIAGALGLPSQGCEFGACGGGPTSFLQGATTAPASWCLEHPTVCTVGVDLAAFARAVPAVMASAMLLNMQGDNKPNPNRCQEVRQRAIAVCTDRHLDGMKDNSGPFFACIRERMAAEGCGY